ncbi:MAG: EpsG family protein [Porphyromonas sp.]|nr:EpsG family protein [Porphyromonas sp.]
MKSNSYLFSKHKSITFSVLLTVTLCLFIGLRPIDITFVDTVTYARLFEQYAAGDYSTVYHTNELAFNFFTYFCAQIMSVSSYFLLLEILYLLPVLISCYKFFKSNSYLALLFFLSSFTFYAYGVNTIRQGISTSLILLMASLILVEEKVYKGIFWGGLGVLFHASAILPFFLLLLSKWCNTFKPYLIMWIVAIIISALFGNTFTGTFSFIGSSYDDRFADYLLNEADPSLFSKTGFRLDFIIYSSPPVLLAYYFIVIKKYHDKIYLRLVFTYMLANIFWILIIRANFSDRFAHLSWFIYPLILAYPLMRAPVVRNQGKLTAAILSIQCFVTVILSLI